MDLSISDGEGMASIRRPNGHGHASVVVLGQPVGADGIVWDGGHTCPDHGALTVHVLGKPMEPCVDLTGSLLPGLLAIKSVWPRERQLIQSIVEAADLQ